MVLESEPIALPSDHIATTHCADFNSYYQYLLNLFADFMGEESGL